MNTEGFKILRNREFCIFLLSRSLATLAGSGVSLVLGYQIYLLTHSKLALGILGLTQALPAISLALVGGHLADNVDRRNMALKAEAVQILVACAFAFLSATHPTIPLLLFLVLIASLAGGFSGPVMGALETELLPTHEYVRAVGWIGGFVHGSALLGPVFAGFAYSYLGAVPAYIGAALTFAISWTCLWFVRSRGRPLKTELEREESMAESIRAGLRFVIGTQPLIGSMALDLFAVLFGGAIALLPVFATDILHVGPRELGFLRAAPSLGAVLAMFWSTGRPPIARAGRNLLLSVALFGVSMIVFGLSTSLYLSLAALFFSGVFDGVNMVVRGAIVRTHTPDEMRGRVTAVRGIFIGASNEIGAFESGFAAQYLGTVPSVWMGGVLTLIIVAATVFLAPELRSLSLNSHRNPPIE